MTDHDFKNNIINITDVMLSSFWDPTVDFISKQIELKDIK